MVSAAPERGQEPRELLGDGPKPPLEVRLYVPMPEVVVVRVSGQLDVLSVPLLIERAGQQFTRAPHVVIDLNDVTFQGEAVVQVLRFLHRQAAAVGTHLHLAADQYSTVRRALQVAELDQLLPISSTAAAVVSRLVPACNNRAATRATANDHGA